MALYSLMIWLSLRCLLPSSGFSENDQTTSGTKDDIIDRVLECVNGGGAIPRCPKCSKGYLRLESPPGGAGGQGYVCPGTYDGKKFLRCDFRAPVSTLPRVPWRELTGRDAEKAEYERRS